MHIYMYTTGLLAVKNASRKATCIYVSNWHV